MPRTTLCEFKFNLQRNVLKIMSNPDTQYDEAVKLKDKGDLEGAVGVLQAIVQSTPSHTLSHSALAVYLHKLGRGDEAIQHAIKVTELEPKDPFSFTQLSVIYVRCGKIQEAEDAKAKAHELTGGHHH